MLGVIYYSQQKYEAAVIELTKAVEIDPRDAEAHLSLAFCAAQRGFSDVASKELETAGRLNPEFKDEPLKAPESDRRWPVGDYLTPLERRRLRLPPAPVVR